MGQTSVDYGVVSLCLPYPLNNTNVKRTGSLCVVKPEVAVAGAAKWRQWGCNRARPETFAGG
jgi:hypothetical protein